LAPGWPCPFTSFGKKDGFGVAWLMWSNLRVVAAVNSVFPDAAAFEECTGSIPTLFLKHGVMHLD
jgi:hypothetical protein